MKKFVIGIIIGFTIGLAGTAVANNATIQATIQSFNFVVDGKQKTLSVDPIVYNGTTYLPVRNVSNLLGYDVAYQAENRTIILTYQGGDQEETQVTGDFISFSELKELGVYIIHTASNTTRIVRNGKFVEINTPNESGEYRTLHSDLVLHIKIEDGETKVRVEELIIAGILTHQD